MPPVESGAGFRPVFATEVVIPDVREDRIMAITNVGYIVYAGDCHTEKLRNALFAVCLENSSEIVDCLRLSEEVDYFAVRPFILGQGPVAFV